MRSLLKKYLLFLPWPVTRTIVHIRETWWQMRMRRWEKKLYPTLPALRPKPARPMRNILIYALNGLSHAGTEKNLQLIANSLVDRYQVFFMCGEKNAEKERASLLDQRITLIPFAYDMSEVAVPHRITGMRPHFKEVLTQHEIDLLITASPGYAHYPWNIVTEIPIVLSNVFGAPTVQKNIAATIFMSQTVRDHAEAWTGAQDTHHTMFLPLGKNAPDNARSLGMALRQKLAISETDFVFGRIGRDSDAIFDPIGIRAWQKIADTKINAHYLIMSPMPALVEIVQREKIPRVHFLPPSGREEDVWAFHGALDCFAHFRLDGETSGVAIAESLAIGNPVITHRSHIWNAHLEYLTDDTARIAPHDDAAAYAAFMNEYIDLRTNHPNVWEVRCKTAQLLGQKHFSPTRYAENFSRIIEQL